MNEQHRIKISTTTTDPINTLRSIVEQIKKEIEKTSD